MKKKFVISIIFEILIVIIGIMGVSLQMGIFTDNLKLYLFNYYTVISNLICVFYSLLKVIYKIKNKGDKEFIPRFKGSIVMCIMVTMLIFHFLLSSSFQMISNTSFVSYISNLMVHYILPSMIILDWLLFDKKGHYKLIDPVIWLSIPLVYFMYALIIGKLKLVTFLGNSYYPYFFMDVDNIGILKTLRNAICLIVVFLILGYLIRFIDNIINKRALSNK